MYNFAEKQVVLLWPQKSKTGGFRLPPPGGWTGRGLHPLSPFTYVQIMENKTKFIKVRVTKTQWEEIKRRTESFGTVTHFINQAIKEFSDKTIKEKMDMETQIAGLYAEMDSKLAHAGANLNQAMRRINERAAVGLDYTGLLTTQLREEVQKCTDICIEIRKALRDITDKIL